MSTILEKPFDHFLPTNSIQHQSVVLEYRTWRKLFTATELRVIMVKALNTAIAQTNATIAGYLISDWAIYLILNASASSAQDFLNVFEKNTEFEIETKQEKHENINSYFITSDNILRSLFFKHPFYPSQALYLALIGKSSTKPYTNELSVKSLHFLQTYNYCSVQDYKGGKGPVNINQNHQSNYLFGINLSLHDDDFKVLSLLEAESYSFAIACFSTGTKVVTQYHLHKKTMQNANWVCGGYHLFQEDDNTEEQAALYLSLNTWSETLHFPPIVKIEIPEQRTSHWTKKFHRDFLAFLLIIEEKTAQKPLIMVSYKDAEHYLNSLKFRDYKLWIVENQGHTPPKLPSIWKEQTWYFCEHVPNYTIDEINSNIEIFNGTKIEFNHFIRHNG